VHHQFGTCTFSGNEQVAAREQVRQMCLIGALNVSTSFPGQTCRASWDGVGVCVFACLLAALHAGTSCKRTGYKQTNRQFLLNSALLSGDEAFGIELADQPIGLVIGDALLLGGERRGQRAHALVTRLPRL